MSDTGHASAGHTDKHLGLIELEGWVREGRVDTIVVAFTDMQGRLMGKRVQGEAFDVTVGDVVVLPAGTGHRRAHADEAFKVVGAYPRGQEDYDLLREADDAARERIAALGAPPDDPVGGDGIARWTGA